MRTFNALAAAALLLGLAASAPSLALDSVEQPNASAKPPLFKTIKDALRAGVKNLDAGDKEAAAKALQYAADEGSIVAQYKLGRMLASGDGVPHDDWKAFRYFSRIADAHADESPDSPNARIVALAFVALGTYHLDGIPNSPVKARPARAFELFRYAATFFGDADAQFNVGRMQLDGRAGARDPMNAARWFAMAAHKGHAYAQAILGQILFTGDGVPKQAALGLAWLELARAQTDPQKEAWVAELHGKAFAAASEADRQLAPVLVKRQSAVIAANPSAPAGTSAGLARPQLFAPVRSDLGPKR